jgi:hypothetical protein
MADGAWLESGQNCEPEKWGHSICCGRPLKSALLDSHTHSFHLFIIENMDSDNDFFSDFDSQSVSVSVFAKAGRPPQGPAAAGFSRSAKDNHNVVVSADKRGSGRSRKSTMIPDPSLPVMNIDSDEDSLPDPAPKRGPGRPRQDVTAPKATASDTRLLDSVSVTRVQGRPRKGQPAPGPTAVEDVDSDEPLLGPVRKRRGRPRKNEKKTPPQPTAVPNVDVNGDQSLYPAPSQRRPGRPRKHEMAPVVNFSSDDGSDVEPAPVEPAPLGERGGPKAPRVREHDLFDLTDSEDGVTESTAPAKRKRGRPRKSETESKQPARRSKRINSPHVDDGPSNKRPRLDLSDDQPEIPAGDALLGDGLERDHNPVRVGAQSRSWTKMSLDEAEALLPDLGQRMAGWDKSDQETLETLCEERGDCALIEEHTRKCIEERPLWKMMLHRYKVHLYDLFRFGLKYDSRGHAGLLPYAPLWVYGNLRVLLSHPVWRDNINAVRLMLQYAIYYRVPGHERPVEAIEYSEAQYALADTLKEELELQAELIQMAVKSASCLRWPEMSTLKDILKHTVQPDPPTDDPVQKELFLLTQHDVTALLRAVDHLCVTPGYRAYRPCQMYFNEYKDFVRRGRDLEPAQTDTIIRWKKTFLLAEKRDWIRAQRFKPRYGLMDRPRSLGRQLHVEEVAMVTPGQARAVSCVHWHFFNDPQFEFVDEESGESASDEFETGSGGDHEFGSEGHGSGEDEPEDDVPHSEPGLSVTREDKGKGPAVDADLDDGASQLAEDSDDTWEGLSDDAEDLAVEDWHIQSPGEQMSSSRVMYTNPTTSAQPAAPQREDDDQVLSVFYRGAFRRFAPGAAWRSNNGPC